MESCLLSSSFHFISFHNPVNHLRLFFFFFPKGKLRIWLKLTCFYLTKVLQTENKAIFIQFFLTCALSLTHTRLFLELL